METLYVVKIGGNVIDDPTNLRIFLKEFSSLPTPKILIHGGGKLATSLAETLGIKQTMIEGRRITDAGTLHVATMVYAGIINKELVALLQSLDCNAHGCSGADSNLLQAKKRSSSPVDYGFVGDVDAESVNAIQFNKMLEQHITPVICAITHDGKGQLLNTNADSIASAIAVAMSGRYIVKLLYCFEKKGVLTDPANEDSYFRVLEQATYSEMKVSGVISKGMIPKLDNAFLAMSQGVEQVSICKASDLQMAAIRKQGTQLT